MINSYYDTQFNRQLIQTEVGGQPETREGLATTYVTSDRSYSHGYYQLASAWSANNVSISPAVAADDHQFSPYGYAGVGTDLCYGFGLLIVTPDRDEWEPRDKFQQFPVYEYDVEVHQIINRTPDSDSHFWSPSVVSGVFHDRASPTDTRYLELIADNPDKYEQRRYIAETPHYQTYGWTTEHTHKDIFAGNDIIHEQRHFKSVLSIDARPAGVVTAFTCLFRGERAFGGDTQTLSGGSTRDISQVRYFNYHQSISIDRRDRFRIPVRDDN